VVLVPAVAPAAAFKSDREKWDAPLLLAADCGWTTATGSYRRMRFDVRLIGC
jgi:hypothetical protein